MRRSDRWKNLVLLATSLVVSLLLGELAVRSFGTDAARWRVQNFVVDPVLSEGRQRTMQPDRLLGHVPKPGYRSVDGHGRSTTFDGNGFRRHGRSDSASSRPPILVTGDSYAMGDEVSDDETVPAYLQETLRRRVINAGVSGYGLDQIVLRTEALLPTLRPQILIVPFISYDVWRAEQRILWGAPKPWFEVEDGALVLRGVPVSSAPSSELDLFRRIAGYSFLVHTTMRRLGLTSYWFRGQVQQAEPSGADGRQIACLLMERLARFARAQDVRVLVVAEYTLQNWPSHPYARSEGPITREVLTCAEAQGLETLDLLPLLTGEVARVGVGSLYRDAHMSPAGNRLVAGQIALKLGGWL